MPTTLDVVTLSREELYEQVWATPMRTLAAAYGMSDLGLANLLDRHDIPRPPRGYWAKLQFGKASPRPPLPPCTDPQLQNVRLSNRPLPRPVAPAPSEQAPSAKKQAAEPIRVPDTLTDPHPLVARTLRSLESARVGDDGLVRPRASRCLAVAVSPTALDRAGRILDALVKAMEARGHHVSAGEEQSRSHGPTGRSGWSRC